ncbi:MAG: hypothetical protein HY801_13115 [Candidatus Lindowbacteria bacterium]|nr:hypothetical protein [Candidatus Lindowbacteria bacterium]
MLSFLNMKCCSCESVYTLSIEELNIVVLFKCFECGHHNMYIAGHVLPLDEQIMTEGTDEEKGAHVFEGVQQFAFDFAYDVMDKVSRIVNVNVEIDLPDSGRRKPKRIKKKARAAKEISGRRVSPSVQRSDAPQISTDEVRDFVKIDLNLIDKQRYFNKFFGKTQS